MPLPKKRLSKLLLTKLLPKNNLSRKRKRRKSKPMLLLPLRKLWNRLAQSGRALKMLAMLLSSTLVRLRLRLAVSWLRMSATR